MSNVYLVRTNQKINFARIHLDALTVAQSSTKWSKHNEIESYNESILFHLASGYASFLREVAERYSFDTSKVSRLADLESMFEESGQESPERSELSILEQSEVSWLHKMLAAYDACWKAMDNHSTVASDTVSISEIHVVQVNPNHAEDGDILAEYKLWLNEFRSLVERLRSDMQEW
ncbi:DUF6586 family protein [Neptunomonas qingdaonensis]|uniref:Uncharacterized protein n=1 Tax=Neptunomonas qingdaonensis TaxID=1045558 RepID=A0A1I2T900_9GAMM|nr:DUF6586 family protein [Neptunomonas qingdaonensis]SFG61473.1 hypothetical protein SAMN05216175_109148 [Neptunomonas qingdaonensis]